MSGVPPCEPADIDLAAHLRPGDRIAVGQVAAEPLSLIKALVAQFDRLPRVGVFVGNTYSDLINDELARGADVASTLGINALGKLAGRGMLDLIPLNYADLPWLMESGPQAPNVVFVQVSPADASGYHSFGVSVDHTADAARNARVVIAEINDQMPATAGPARIHSSRIHASIRVSRPLITMAPVAISDSEKTIARHVSDLVVDGATIQLGIGAVPSAVAKNLCDRRDLRVQSGLIGDWVMDLARAGALETLPQSDLVRTGAAFGSQELYDFVASSSTVVFDNITQLNRIDLIARIPRFTAINSALQVDLSGQVNAEIVAGRYLGAIGGQTDFMRAAQLSANGRSIIALPSATANGAYSRIVMDLDHGCVTTPKAYVDYVVTEYGTVSLRGKGLRDRAAALIEIANPAFREGLRAEFSAKNPKLGAAS